jgi:hypothetical protein
MERGRTRDGNSDEKQERKRKGSEGEKKEEDSAKEEGGEGIFSILRG